MAYIKNCLKTKRTMVDTYKGYPIFLEQTLYYRPCAFNAELYDTENVSSRSEYYMCGTKNGNISKGSDRYSYCCGSVADAKELIDSIENGKVVLTEKERYDWVLVPNSKNSWGFTPQMLICMMRSYKKASPRRRVGYLERLEDANFHSEYDALEREDYIEFERLANCL